MTSSPKKVQGEGIGVNDAYNCHRDPDRFNVSLEEMQP